MTYQQAYDEIIQAYHEDKIEPFDSEFCFCGTLSPNYMWNRKGEHTKTKYPYTFSEYRRMEHALLRSFEPIGVELLTESTEVSCMTDGVEIAKKHPQYEEYLFKGMCDALEVLKQIHKERGEIIDEVPVFTKRQLHVSL